MIKYSYYSHDKPNRRTMAGDFWQRQQHLSLYEFRREDGFGKSLKTEQNFAYYHKLMIDVNRKEQIILKQDII